MLVVALQDMPRPFKKLREHDIDALAEEIAAAQKYRLVFSRITSCIFIHCSDAALGILVNYVLRLLKHSGHGTAAAARVHSTYLSCNIKLCSSNSSIIPPAPAALLLLHFAHQNVALQGWEAEAADLLIQIQDREH